MQKKMSKIKNSYIKEMYQEVLTLANSGYYNSAIVRLYAMVNYDLIIKIQELHKYTESDTLKDLEEELRRLISGEMAFTKAEKLILDKLKEKSIVSLIFYDKVCSLRKIRNWCAHPAFYDADAPYKSTYYEVISYLEFFYNELLVNNYYFLLKWKDNIQLEIDEKCNLYLRESEYETKENLRILEENLANDVLNNLNSGILNKVLKDLINLQFIRNTEVLEKTPVIQVYLCCVIDILRTRNDLENQVFNLINENKLQYIETLDESNVQFKAFLELISKKYITIGDLESRPTLLVKIFEFTRKSFINLLYIGEVVYGSSYKDQFKFNETYYSIYELKEIEKKDSCLLEEFNYYNNFIIGANNVPNWDGFNYCDTLIDGLLSISEGKLTTNECEGILNILKQSSQFTNRNRFQIDSAALIEKYGLDSKFFDL